MIKPQPLNLRQLLKMIRSSIHGPWPPRTEDDPPAIRARVAASEPVAMPHTVLSPAVSEVIRTDTALRMICIQTLREEDALTEQEMADLLRQNPETIKSQFLKLRRLGLIEQAGCRKTSAGIQAAYRLNTNNPALEFVLAPMPEAVASPHEVSERQSLRWE
jgi:hypothetical protein